MLQEQGHLYVHISGGKEGMRDIPTLLPNNPFSANMLAAKFRLYAQMRLHRL